MQEQKKRLIRELQQNTNVKIMDSREWCVPVYTIEVTYRPIKRIKMDVLMKMMLLSFQKANIENARQLSEILLVDQLFVEDLISLMKKSGLIKVTTDKILLTSKGEEQLGRGIFEEEQELETEQLLYSQTHDSFLLGEIKPASEGEENLQVFRHAPEKRQARFRWEEDVVIEALHKKGVLEDKGETQIIIGDIVATEELYVDDVPCLEFILHNESDDSLYARVWNTLSDEWDKTLEEMLVEQERVSWREKYLD